MPDDETRGTPDPGECKFLDPATSQFCREEGARLRFRQSGDDEWAEVKLALLFPLSEPDKLVAVLNSEGKEIGIIRNVNELSKDSRVYAKDEIRRRYVVPQITRIVSTRDRFDIVEWDVETDRGSRKFVTRRVQESAQRPTENRITLIDAEDNRYDIPDIEALDPLSRHMLEDHI